MSKMEADKENIVQAVVITDLFNNNFKPISKHEPMALQPVAGVPLIDYVLESLASGGVGETILFSCQGYSKIKIHISKRKEEKVPWSLGMDVQIMASDTCQTMGDVMREIDAAGLIRGCFVLLGVNTITNINFAALLEQHKQLVKKDKGAAMTLVYKKVSWEHPLISNDKSTFIAANGRTGKVLMHKKYKPKSKEANISLPLECVLNNQEVKLHHNLIDANIALCSPSVPPLFADNFDFQTRNDFIHGILINEDILASSLYYTLVKPREYAALVSNWKTYQIVSWDLLHDWVHPLSIETGTFDQNSYIHMGNYKFRKPSSILSRSCLIKEDILIGADTHINDMADVDQSMIGENCTIGQNVKITNSHIMNNVIIKDNCKLTNCFIDNNTVVEENSILEGVIASSYTNIAADSKLKGNVLDTLEGDIKTDKTRKSTSESGTEWENESVGSGNDDFIGLEKEWSDSDTCYSSASSDISSSSSLSDASVQEDTNIFLQEVIDSLSRGYEEKLKCDYLILEINSSRYAYNIQLHEVNFFVVQALLSMAALIDHTKVLGTLKDILKFFQPVLLNYIKTKSAIMDCLKAVEHCCIKYAWLDSKAGQVVHLLYDEDIVDEDSLLEWYRDLKETESPIASQSSMIKFFEWLQEASEESGSE